MTDAREIRALVEDRPDLEPALESLLETDDAHETWTFDDTGLDSGTFGELVSEGVVEKVDGEYRLADPGAVERALGGGVPSDGEGGASLAVPSVDVDRRVAAALTGALVLVLCFRILTFDAVFRGGRVVLSGNDPYYYLYLTEELTRQSAGVLDLGVLAGGGVFSGNGEPLLLATLWFATALVGGVEQAPLVLAWYPVVAGVVTGLFVYLLATGLTEDRRVGLAAVVMLAVMPVLAFRSGLGFADHHAFDYVWLAMTATAAVRVARTPATAAAVRRPRAVGAVVALGLAITGQLLAWEAGPLLAVPLALYVSLAALIALDAGESPLFRLLPFAGGFALAALLTLVVHLGFGWQSTAVVATPVLLSVGTVGVASAAAVIRRAPDLPVSPLRALAGIELVGGAAVVALLAVGLPSLGDRLFGQFGRLGSDQSIVEAASVFSSDTFGWLFLFGFLLFLAVPYVGWALVRAARGGDDRHRWLIAGSYATVLLVLAALQMRFAGELSMFVAVFAGLGFIHIAARVDLAHPPVPFGGTRARGDGGDAPALTLPSPRTAGALLFLFLLLGGLSIIQAPVKANQITISDATYDSAAWIEQRAAERELAPEDSYVLSDWGRNRVYNYFVNGQSRGYGYALNNYRAFVRATEFDPWYERLDDRVEYIVLSDAGLPPGTLQYRLSRAGGGRYQGSPGSGHFRLVHISGHQIYELVPGANVTGEAPPNSTVQLETGVEVSGTQFTYTRWANTTADGSYSVRVAYPGEYTATHMDRNTTTTVAVSEAAVGNGERIDTGSLRPDGNTTTDDQARLAAPAYQVSPS